MSDIVNAFKQKASKKRANWQSEDDNTSALQDFQKKRQENTIQQQTQDNKALESARQQNIQNKNTTSYSEKLAALQQAAAAEQAQNAANAAAQQQAQQQAQQKANNQTTTQTVTKDNDGWKKYYDSEKQKVREQAQKANAFDTWLQDVFNSGWDTRLAETQARNKYAQEMLKQSTDESGNVTDQNKLNEVKQFAAYNSNVAKANSDYEHAKANMYGATKETKNQNPFKSTANAIRNMDVGSAIVGSNDVEGTEGAKYNNLKDAGRFLANLLPGLANAPTTGLTNVSEAITGKGTNYDTGLEEDLDTLSRVGRGASGAIDVAGTFFGGSKELVNGVANSIFKKGATEAAKQATKQTTKGAIKELTKSMLEEGGEEAVQQVADFFGNGGKLVTSDGQFDQDSFNDLLKETAQAGALGAVGGGIFHAGGKGIQALSNKINNAVPKAPDAGEVSNISNKKISDQTRNENAAQMLRETEGNVVENTTENVGQNINEDIEDKAVENREYNRQTDRNIALDYYISSLKESDKYNSLDTAQKNEVDSSINSIVGQLNSGLITENESKTMIDAIKNKFDIVTDSDKATQSDVSATGQQVNPQDVSNVVTEAQGTQANDVTYTNYKGEQKSVLDNIKNTQIWKRLSDDQKNAFLNSIKERKDQLKTYNDMTGSNREFTTSDFNQMFEDFEEKQNRKLNKEFFNSEENQNLLKQIGTDSITKARAGKSNNYGVYKKFQNNITVYLDAINSEIDMTSTEVHESAHAAWKQVPVENKVEVGKDLLGKLGLNIEVSNEIARSGHLSELISYSCETKFTEGENINTIDKTAQRHLDAIAKMAGNETASFKEKVLEMCRTFATYIKGKISGVLDVKTFDDFYNGLMNGDFAQNIKQNNPYSVMPENVQKVLNDAKQYTDTHDDSTARQIRDTFSYDWSDNEKANRINNLMYINKDIDNWNSKGFVEDTAVETDESKQTADDIIKELGLEPGEYKSYDELYKPQGYRNDYFDTEELYSEYLDDITDKKSLQDFIKNFPESKNSPDVFRKIEEITGTKSSVNYNVPPKYSNVVKNTPQNQIPIEAYEDTSIQKTNSDEYIVNGDNYTYDMIDNSRNTNTNGYYSFANDNLERVLPIDSLAEKIVIGEIRPGGYIDHMNTLSRKNFANVGNDIIDRVGDFGYKFVGFDRDFLDYVLNDPNSLGIYIEYYKQNYPEKYKQYVKEVLSKNDGKSDYEKINQLKNIIINRDLKPEINEALKGNYAAKKDLILYRGLNRNGNVFDEAGNFGWIKNGYNSKSNDYQFVTLSKKVASKFAGNNGIVLEYHIPKGSKLFYFGDYGLGVNNGGAFVLPPNDFSVSKVNNNTATIYYGNKVPNIDENTINKNGTSEATPSISLSKTSLREKNIPNISDTMSEPAKKEQARIVSTLNDKGLSNQDISEIASDTGRGLRDIYAVTQANTKGKFAIDQAIKSGDTNFVKNLIKKYLREGTYDKEIARFKETMPSIYGIEGRIDFSNMEYTPSKDENGRWTMSKNTNPRLDALKQKIQAAKDTGRITPETIEYIKNEIASNKTTDEKIANIEKIFEPVAEPEVNAEQEIIDLVNTANNVEPEPIPMEAYGTTEEVAEPVINTDNLPDRVGNITENYLTEDNYTIDQMRDLSNRINTVAEREANALGTTMENIRREVNRAERAGLSRLDQTELTAEQQDLYRRYLNELNTIRGFSESQGKQTAGDIGELYLPNQMLGWEDNYKPLEGFNTQRPGSEIARGENRIDVEEQDFGTDPIDRYFIEHGASDAVKQQHAIEAVSDITGNAEPNPESVKEYIKLQEDINNVVSKNPLKLTQKSGKETVSPSNVINKIGTDNGTQQQPIYGKARGLTDEDKLTSVEVPSRKSPTGKVSVFEAGGYSAYRQAPSYAADVMNRSRTENGFDTATFRNTANEYIDTFNLSQNDAEYFKDRIGNLSPYLSDKAATKTLEFIFRDAARTQNMGFLSSHNVSGDTKLQQVIDRQSTIMLRDNSIEKSAATKMTNGILKLQNAAFRKMNVSSALNELSDLSSMLSVTGRNFRPVFKRGIAAKYGMSEAEIDPAVMAEISGADGAVDQNKLKTYIKKINNGTNLYHFVEQYKLNVALTSFEKMGINQGLSGKELVDFVTSNTRKVILPVDQFTHTFLNDYPLFTQYMPWTLRNLQKEGKLLTGSYEGGVYQTGGTLSKNRLARVAYNAVTNLPLKTIYWLSSNALKGTALATAFGLLELGGDYSGIDDEDKNWYEKYLTQVTGTSTIGSLINSVEYALHKEDLKNQYADSDYNPYENEDLGSSLGDIALTHFVPAGSQIKKTAQEGQVLGQGYSENKAGKVQYLDSENPLDALKGLLFGKSSTDNGREYSGNLDVATRIQNKLDEGSDVASAIVSSITDMAKEDLNLQDREYNRPLSNAEQNNYSQMVKDTTGQEQKDWYEKGQAYNAITDTLRRENPDAYEVYESTFSKEIVSPERYARIAYGNGDQNTESIDLTVWNTMKDLANKRHEDFGTAIDPAYTDLDDEQTREYLQYKSTATGEDILLKKEMCVDEFWDSFFDKQSDYYANLDYEDDDSQYSQRVQQWNDYNDQYGDYMKFISGKVDDMDNQELALQLTVQFPLMYEYQSLKTALKSKYGDEYKDSTEYKNFWSNNYDAYQEESEAFNTQVLYIINQMRTIEGFDEMTLDQLEAINEFGYDDSSSSGYSSSSSSDGGYSYAPSFENIFSAAPLYTKNYHSKKSVKANLAGKPSFESIDFSSSSGYDPYNSVA